MGLSTCENSGGYCVLRRDGWVFLVGDKFSPCAQVLCASAPHLDGGPMGVGALSCDHVLCLRPKALFT